MRKQGGDTPCVWMSICRTKLRMRKSNRRHRLGRSGVAPAPILRGYRPNLRPGTISAPKF
jgi:hypothetical protein